MRWVIAALSLAACGGAPGAPTAAFAPTPPLGYPGASGVAMPADTAMDGRDVTLSQDSAKTEGVPKPAPLTRVPPSPPGTTPSKGPAQGGTTDPAETQMEAPHETAMLVYTANLTMAVYQVEPGLAAIEKIGRDSGGYLAVKTDRAVTIRVPRARFDEALREVEKTGDVVHREVIAEDVTDQFVDIDARLKNARAMRDRLQELLKKAATKEAIEIEVQLERVMGEIESMEGKLKLLKDKIAFSTIAVTFEPRGASAVRDMPIRLPFVWLTTLGLPRLLSLSE